MVQAREHARRRATYRDEEKNESRDVREVENVVCAEPPDREGKEEQDVDAHDGDDAPRVARF